jgi:hypothetical protein
VVREECVARELCVAMVCSRVLMSGRYHRAQQVVLMNRLVHLPTIRTIYISNTTKKCVASLHRRWNEACRHWMMCRRSKHRQTRRSRHSHSTTTMSMSKYHHYFELVVVVVVVERKVCEAEVVQCDARAAREVPKPTRQRCRRRSVHAATVCATRHRRRCLTTRCLTTTTAAAAAAPTTTTTRAYRACLTTCRRSLTTTRHRRRSALTTTTTTRRHAAASDVLLAVVVMSRLLARR